MSEQSFDLGHGHSYKVMRGKPAWWPNDGSYFEEANVVDGDIDGVLIDHPRRGADGVCKSYAQLRPDPSNAHTSWKVEDAGPGYPGFTISPSVLCATCGDHGFIQQGRWVPVG